MDNTSNIIGPYKLNKTDILSFRRNSMLKKNILIRYIIFFSIFGVISGLNEFFSSYSWLKSIFNAILSIVLFGGFFLILMIVVALFSDNAKKLCKNNLEIHISGNSVSAIQDDNSSSYAWRNIDCIRVTESHIYVYVTPFCAYIIPKRIFASKKEAASFIENINEKFEYAKNNPHASKS